MELSDHALAHPVSMLRRLLDLALGGALRHLRGGLLLLARRGGWLVGRVFVLDGGFVVRWRRRLRALSDAAGILGGGVLDRARGGRSGRVLALGAAFDDEGVGVGELDADVFLGDAGEFAVELVGVFDFFDVEAGLEGADAGGAAVGGAGGLGAVDVVVVEEAEEGAEVGGGGEGGEE